MSLIQLNWSKNQLITTIISQFRNSEELSKRKDSKVSLQIKNSNISNKFHSIKLILKSINNNNDKIWSGTQLYCENLVGS